MLSRRLLVCSLMVFVCLAAVPSLAAAGRIAGPPVAVGDTMSQAVQRFVAGERAAGDSFGYSIAVSGNTAVVGARQYADTPYGPVTAGPGAAYVFTLTGGVWTPAAKLVAEDGALGDRFGTSVAIDGATVLVGASYDDDSEQANSGSVYVFEGSGATWAQTQKLTASDAAIDDLFGASVSISGNTAAIGAYAENDDEGAVYVFTKTSGTWGESARLTDAVPRAANRFGRSVALSGTTLMVGAPGFDPPASTIKGKVVVFTGSGATWTWRTDLAPAGLVAGDRFGGTVLLSGSTAVIGAWGDVTVASGILGVTLPAFYTYSGSGAAWTQTARTTALDGPMSSYFGSSIAMSGGSTFVGVDWEDLFNYKGAAYAYGPKVPLTTVENTPLSVPAPGVLVNDFDTNFPAFSLSATQATTPAHGTVALAASGGFVYTPAAGYSGIDTFTYRAWNGYVLSESAVVTITVTPADMRTPVSPYRVGRGRLFQVYGATPMRHRPGTYPVVLDCYRFEDGRWVLRKSLSMRAYAYPRGTKYGRWLRLALRGHWRLVARHAEGDMTRYSVARYMYVR
jgi:hypothetical protein